MEETMDELTLKKRLQVVYFYFSGLSFDQVAAKTGISKGSVANIVSELKAGNFPEAADVTDQIEALRELSVNLNKLKTTVGKSVVGIAILSRIFELGLDPADMEKWPLLLSAIKSQDDAGEIIGVAYVVRGMQQETGLSLPALEEKVNNLGEKAKELEVINNKIGEQENQFSDLTKNNQDLTQAVSSLDKQYKWLLPRVQELEHREKMLLDRYESRFSEAEKADEILKTIKLEMKKLQKTGFTVQGLTEFNRNIEIIAKRRGIKPSVIQERLLMELRHLDKGTGLETLAKNQQQILKETNQAIAKKNIDKSNLEAILDNLQQQKQNLETSIKETTESVRLQIESIVPAAKTTVMQVTEDLKSGCAEVLSDVYQLRAQSIEVGKDIGQYEGVLKTAEWVKKLTVLVHGGADVNAQDVRSIALLVNQSFCAWLQQHGTDSPNIELLALNTNKLLQEIAKWSV
jgi:predicted  nucleic acid-binding Zn-ribbon protein